MGFKVCCNAWTATILKDIHLQRQIVGMQIQDCIEADTSWMLSLAGLQYPWTCTYLLRSDGKREILQVKTWESCCSLKLFSISFGLFQMKFSQDHSILL